MGSSTNTLQTQAQTAQNSNPSKIHTTETAATRSYISIPASAKARLATDMTTGRSPATSFSFINSGSMKNRYKKASSLAREEPKS